MKPAYATSPQRRETPRSTFAEPFCGGRGESVDRGRTDCGCGEEGAVGRQESRGRVAADA